MFERCSTVTLHLSKIKQENGRKGVTLSKPNALFLACADEYQDSEFPIPRCIFQL